MSKPEIFTTAYAIDKAFWLHNSDDVGFMEHIKNHLGHQLAERIFQECQSGEKIVTIDNTYEKEIHELYQVEIRENVSIEDLVRCKDCQYWEQATPNSGNCNRALEITAYANDYCSYGKRRNE